MRIHMRRGRARSGGLLALFLLTLVVVLAACGGGSTSLDGAAGGQEQAAATMAPAPAPAVEQPASGEDNGFGTGSGSGSDEEGGNPAAPRDDLMIVYTGSLNLVVDDLPTALAKAKAAVLATGGYIGASEEYNDEDRAVAVITYRIPADRWEDGLGSLRGLATKVVGEQTQATEVGGQMVDLEARIRNLRASEEVLVEIAKGTGKVSDLLEVEARIADVRGQIEVLEGQRARLADQVAYGTLVATFGTEIVQVQEAAKGWDPKEDVDGALATLISAGQALVSFLIWFVIVWLPVLLVLGVLTFIGWKVAKRISRRATTPATPRPGPGWGTPPEDTNQG
jgi:flagellar basal body-associated protein FliL